MFFDMIKICFYTLCITNSRTIFSKVKQAISNVFLDSYLVIKIPSYFLQSIAPAKVVVLYFMKITHFKRSQKYSGALM